MIADGAEVAWPLPTWSSTAAGTEVTCAVRLASWVPVGPGDALPEAWPPPPRCVRTSASTTATTTTIAPPAMSSRLRRCARCCAARCAAIRARRSSPGPVLDLPIPELPP